MDCLNAGKNIFVEKPLADSSIKCRRLIDIANKKSLSIFVDHTFLYTSAVNKMKEISHKEILVIYFIMTIRVLTLVWSKMILM